ncbi:hypothetical protein [Beggiatoa leptomitoformis]|uniref:Dioxygenase n=1 Tax=Beggiatoa leptomitoformis TaxID=288004 RepID=A0A2N9YEN1_9GAMM|nr:hypothetical protein [Beggiatoa leptomitoformis]ALG68713.1 hypothetical protein AL038_14630 [Beggiatoa leptomitoformis]AUI68932.1 hypothetical protein BLE401_09620 [Beggiatoa leptomitoformis]
MSISPSFATTGQQHHFFGYYDKSPLDKSARRLLCLQTDFTDRLPTAEDVATIGYWSLTEKTFHKLAETRAFNWQQGCMLQWLGPDYDRYIIFNDRDAEHFISIILDTQTGERTTLPSPIYSVHPNGKSAITVDFERLYFPRRSYAYAGIENAAKNQKMVEGDGIFWLDFQQKSLQPLISTQQMYETEHLSSMAFGDHYLEHLMFCPDGERFLFLHRWVLDDGGIFSRLYSARKDGRDIRLLLNSGKVTHFNWLGNQQVIAWGGLPNPLNKLRQHRSLVKLLFKPLLPLYHRFIKGKLARKISGQGYILLNDALQTNAHLFAEHCLQVDGHPSWNPQNPQWLVTDTYQDDEFNQWLYLYNVQTKQLIIVDKLHTPPEFADSPMRCDLHPRWDFTGRYICVDSLHTGQRQMYIYDVANLMS